MLMPRLMGDTRLRYLAGPRGKRRMPRLSRGIALARYSISPDYLSRLMLFDILRARPRPAPPLRSAIALRAPRDCPDARPVAAPRHVYRPRLLMGWRCLTVRAGTFRLSLKCAHICWR